MDTNQYKYHRHSIRLKNYDYSSNGAYFVTICTQNREYLFGDVVDGKMETNSLGNLVISIWESLPQHHFVELDEFQIMPNHVHMVIIILRSDPVGCRGFARKTPTFGHVESGSLSCIIRSFKSEITKQIRIIMENPEFPVWQRNYYEHVIRNEIELEKIREYIESNPAMWDRDRNNPENIYI